MTMWPPSSGLKWPCETLVFLLHLYTASHSRRPRLELVMWKLWNS